MPIYEYICTGCTYKFETLQPMSVNGTSCPRCGQAARRAISLFAAYSRGESGEVSAVAGTGGCAACSGGACACCSHH